MKKKSTKEFSAKVIEHGFAFSKDGYSARAIKFDSLYSMHKFPVGYDIAENAKDEGRIAELEKGVIHNCHWSTGYSDEKLAVENARNFKNDEFVKKHNDWRRTNPGIAESFSVAPRRTLIRGDHGSELDTQKYLAGKVDSMWSRHQKVKREKRNHRIVMSLGASFGIKPEDMNLTAIAVMEMMLNIGPSAEFITVSVNDDVCGFGNLIIDTLVKKSGQPMCRSTVSYAASVMMFRMGVFSILDSLDGLTSGYGVSIRDEHYQKYIEDNYRGATMIPRITTKDQLNKFLQDFRENKLKPIGAA